MDRPTILVIDDDPSHLQIYCWILQAAGFRGIPALVHRSVVDLPENEKVDLILLDYRLSGEISAVEVARFVNGRYPEKSIVVLSDLFGLPSDIAPFARAFVRKGEPERLIQTISSLVNPEHRGSPGQSSGTMA